MQALVPDCKNEIIKKLSDKYGYAMKASRQLARTCKYWRVAMRQTKDYYTICQFYLKYGNRIHVSPQYDLMRAAIHGYLVVVKYIYRNAARSVNWTNILIEALQNKSYKITRFIVDTYGMMLNLNYQNTLQLTYILDKTVSTASLKFVLYLVKHAPTIICVSNLKLNAYDKRLDVFRYIYFELVSKHSNYNAAMADYDLDNIIRTAICNNAVKICRFLDTYRVISWSKYLIYALQNVSWDVVKFILRRINTIYIHVDQYTHIRNIIHTRNSIHNEPVRDIRRPGYNLDLLRYDNEEIYCLIMANELVFK